MPSVTSVTETHEGLTEVSKYDDGARVGEPRVREARHLAEHARLAAARLSVHDERLVRARAHQVLPHRLEHVLPAPEHRAPVRTEGTFNIPELHNAVRQREMCELPSSALPRYPVSPTQSVHQFQIVQKFEDLVGNSVMRNEILDLGPVSQKNIFSYL